MADNGLRWTTAEVEAYYAKRGLPVPEELKAPTGAKQSAPQEPEQALYPVLTKVLTFHADLPPSVNHAYRNVPGVGRVLTKEAKEYKTTHTLLVALAARKQGWWYTAGERIRLTIYLYFGDATRDLDNAVKLLQDAVATGARFNDKVVDVLHVEATSRSSQNPHAVVIVEIR